MRILPTLFYIETKKELSVWRPKNRESPLGERMKAGQCRIICLVQSGARMSIAIVLRGKPIKHIHGILHFVLMDEMVFCYQNCSDLLWEKVVLVIEKNFEIRGWRLRICKHFEITRTIYSNSERSEQFLVKFIYSES